MKLSIKDYKIARAKKYFKSGDFFFFVNGLNQNSLNWLLTKQKLKTVEFNDYKILNTTTVKTLNTSIYAKITLVTKGSTFLIKPQQTKLFLKQTILITFNPLFFELLIIKFNNRIYSADSIKNIYSLEYTKTKLLFYQFNLTHLKTYSKFSK